MTRVLVYGAGAIGQWVAGRLSLAGEDVTVLWRRDPYQAISARGVRIQQDGRILEASGVRAVERLSGVAPDFDWIFLTVKAFDVASALADLRAAGFLESARVMGFQNGVGTEELCAEAVGGARTAVCVVTKPIGIAESPGEVIEASPKGGLAIAPFVTGTPLGPLDEGLVRSGLSVARFDDYRPMKWSKLLLNMTANAVCAIVDASPAEVYADRRLFRVESAAFVEAGQVMRALRIPAANFPDYPARTLYWLMMLVPRMIARRVLYHKVGTARGSKQPSLRIEMERSRPVSEVDYLNGAVVKYGRAAGVRTPANAFLTDTLNGIVRGTIPWERYRGAPDRFLGDYFSAAAQEA